jgi:8-hydroxy-5-deazaflavin:NADPH oxidoreductase
MRVGILGTGQVAQILGAGFLAKGYDVTLGTRNPQAKVADTKPGKYGRPPLSAWLKAHPKVKVATLAEAAKFGEFVVCAVFGRHIESAIKAAGPENLAGKLVIDTSNGLEFGPSGAHLPKNIQGSCMQVAQRAAPKAKFVKAWNCTPGDLMVNPKQGPGDQLICGDDDEAKKQVAKILKEFGWRVADVGDSTMAPYVEGAGLAVINFAAKINDWGWILALPGRRE